MHLTHVERQILENIRSQLGTHEAAANRFHPYVGMHEFEALLFSEPAAAARGMGQPHLANELQTIRNGFQNPEEINDSYETAPGKRLERLFEGRGIGRFEKGFMGPLAALEVGLEAMRQQCPHFAEWIDRLENLPI